MLYKNNYKFVKLGDNTNLVKKKYYLLIKFINYIIKS